MKWIRALSVPSVLTVLCLLGLGVNGLIQVGLQKDMTKKATQLNKQVATAQNLSGQMKDSLTGLKDLKTSTQHMQGTLLTLASTTGDMDEGLALLYTTVNGISGSIHTLGQSTQTSKSEIESARQTSAQLLSLLQGMVSVNSTIINHLNQMMTDQNGINQDLQSLNQKTQILP
jgi:chromosome segregation ATPase